MGCRVERSIDGFIGVLKVLMCMILECVEFYSSVMQIQQFEGGLFVFIYVYFTILSNIY